MRRVIPFPDHALDVAPVHLILPVDGDERLKVGANVIDCTPAELRAWIRGQRPLLLQDPRIYRSEVPRNELPEERTSSEEDAEGAG